VAQSAGADRVELCSDYRAGGITPSRSAILSVRRKIKIPLFVLIRPRGGDFIFSEKELSVMKEDIVFCRENDVNGIVTGALNGDGEPDRLLLEALTVLSSPMEITFHRAIDSCEDRDSAIRTLVSLGIQGVLTAGGHGAAADHVSELRTLYEKFGSQIKILPGGNIRSDNIKMMLGTGCKEFHSSCITQPGMPADENEIKRMKLILIESST